MRIFSSIVLITCFVSAFSQKLNSRSRYEKRWALLHPFAALKVKKIYKKCMPYYEEAKSNNTLDVFENGGKLDCYRHVFFMAAFSRNIKVKKLRKLGYAHEKGNYSNFLKGTLEEGELADSLSCAMDLKNNEFGFYIGTTLQLKTLKELSELTIERIKGGEAVYMKRNAAGQYLTCGNEIIDLADYKTKWFIPKCIIKTNE